MFNVIAGAADAVARAARYAVAGQPGASASFRVEPDRVYELANRFEAIADKIDGGIGQEIMHLEVASPGGDEPSHAAAYRLNQTAFGDFGLVTRLEEYVTELRKVATTLRQTGQQYGLTDHTQSGRLGATDV